MEEQRPQRERKTHDIHLQKQSHVVGRLSVELRDLIYRFLWEGHSALWTNKKNKSRRQKREKTRSSLW
jgi:hypothetical protein